MSMQPPPRGAPPPGWYRQAGAQRYWDGMQWTQHMAPLARSSSSNIPLWLFLFFGPIVFGIMGMISANRGDYYRYPVAFRFIKGPTAPAK